MAGTVIVPVPTLGMPPTPADTYSVLTSVANWTTCDPKHHRLNRRIREVLRHRALRRLGILCFLTMYRVCRNLQLNRVPGRRAPAAEAWVIVGKKGVSFVAVFDAKY